MTTRDPAFNSSLHRDVRDVLAIATLIMFFAMIVMITPG
jgi:hypothetical protein